MTQANIKRAAALFLSAAMVWGGVIGAFPVGAEEGAENAAAYSDQMVEETVERSEKADFGEGTEVSPKNDSAEADLDAESAQEESGTQAPQMLEEEKAQEPNETSLENNVTTESTKSTVSDPSKQEETEETVATKESADPAEKEEERIFSAEELRETMQFVVESASQMDYLQEADLKQLALLRADVDKTLNLLSAEEKKALGDLNEKYQNACACLDELTRVFEAAKNGTLDQLEVTGKENSWRYQNGESADVSGVTLFAASQGTSDHSYVGIDVSHHQGEIDWDVVKKYGNIDFVIIRCGYGGGSEGGDDKYWARNVAACERLGIPYGVYLYSYATSEEDAREEAQHALQLLKGHKPALPVYLDLEEARISMTGTEMVGKIAQTFCNTVKAQGYSVGIYGSLYWWNNHFTDKAFNNDTWWHWVAQIGHDTCNYEGRYETFQFTDKASVAGIVGTVDQNYWYGGLPTYGQSPKDIKNGLVYDSASNKWRYYKNGIVDTSYNGLAKHEASGVYYYLERGEINWNYQGIASYENKKGYVTNGRLDTGKNGLIQWNGGWYYLKNGWVDTTYVGLVHYSGDNWYLCKKWSNRLEFYRIGKV